MDYLEWNTKLAEHFFSPSMVGRKVYLFATEELVEKLGQSSGVGLQDFLEAVKLGARWVQKREGICLKALHLLQSWRYMAALIYPPYIAYLALFVMAAGRKGNFAPHAYYPRLRDLLGEFPGNQMYPGFDRMVELWNDLERWSNTDKGGAWGEFQVRTTGSWIHCGIPVTQAILSEDERHGLPSLFAEAAIDPSSPPAEEELACLVVKYGRGMLRQRTLSRLKEGSATSDETRQALIERLLEELNEWDGAGIQSGGEDSEGTHHGGSLRLCCKLDRVAGTTEMTLRCKTAQDFPEEGLELNVRGGNTTDLLICEEDRGGWSSPLRERSGKLLDAAFLDWISGVQMEGTPGKWKFRLSTSPVRLLVDGGSENLGGFIEVWRLPAAAQFYLLVHPQHCEAIERWGREECDGWRALQISRGLPVGWSLYTASRAKSDRLVRKKYPCLSLPESISILLQGGIRVAKSNRYFDFAPPLVEMRGLDLAEARFNGQAVAPGADGRYEIPLHIPSFDPDEPGKILVEAIRSGETAARLAIYLSGDGSPWTGLDCRYWLGADGDSARGEVHRATQGALTQAPDLPPFNFGGLVIPTDQGTIYYIGPKPGQIVCWPGEPLSDQWSPTWVVAAKRRGRLIFCGTDVLEAEPVPGSLHDRRKIKKWKEFVRGRCKELVPPNHAQLRALWRRYQELARHD